MIRSRLALLAYALAAVVVVAAQGLQYAVRAV
jgi:hypothetical protein